MAKTKAKKKPITLKAAKSALFERLEGRKLGTKLLYVSRCTCESCGPITKEIATLIRVAKLAGSKRA